MALLGTWIDKTSLQTLGGANSAGNSFQTVAHFVGTIGSGLQASTNPDTGIIVVRSVQQVLATIPTAILPFWFGANASIATLGLSALGTFTGGPTTPLVAVDVFNVYFWNPIR